MQWTSESFSVMTLSFSVSGTKVAVMGDFRRSFERLLETEINSFMVKVDSIRLMAFSNYQEKVMRAAHVVSLCTESNWRSAAI